MRVVHLGSTSVAETMRLLSDNFNWVSRRVCDLSLQNVRMLSDRKEL